MMMSAVHPSKLLRQIAAVGLAVLVLIAFAFGVVAPLADHIGETRDARTSLKMTLDRHAQAGRDLPRLKTQLADLKRERRSEDGYLTEANETLAAAALQSRIKASVLQSGGQLFSMENLPPNKEGGLQKIAIRARASLGLAGLQQVFIALNETQPVLRVDSLEVASTEGNRSTAPASDALDVDFTVYGYLEGTE